MEGIPPSTLAMPGAMSELRGDASLDDYCPYPPPPGRPWWLTAILFFGLPLFLCAGAFKWYTKQRILYALIENTMLMVAPFLLDSQIVRKTPFVGKYLIRLFFWFIQRKVPYPPQHLMSSAPSNSPGILTVLKKESKLAGCKYKDILTSDDFPVLPAQPRIFRTVDGFGNCPYSPHIGQAAQPYSYVATSKPPKIGPTGEVLQTELPPTKAIFDTLFKRETFEGNEAGLNCLILDFATLLTHDLFNSHNGYNANSSYADLSPLYGNDPKTARRVRVFKRGLLDLKKVPYSRAATVEERFFEAALERELGGEDSNESAGDPGLQAVEAEDAMGMVAQAKEWNWDWGFVGWRALVELFGKEHNHVAGKLLEWYPDKFSQKIEKVTKQKELGALYDENDNELKGRWINDELLYQTARYITTRIYGNIVVTDYASNFLGLKQLNDFFDGRPEKLGNSCSYEFGLLYHWHCLLPDDSPDAKQPRGVPCDKNDENLSNRGPLDGDYYDQLSGEPYEKKLDDLLRLHMDNLPKKVDQAKAELQTADKKELKAAVDHLPDTELKLDDLLLMRSKTQIGRFGAFHTPKYLKQAEIRTMENARKQCIGSYNDFRAHLGLMRCTTYEEINPDKDVAAALRKLYETKDKKKGNENVDDVELYPGVFAERSGHKGIKFGNILSLGLLEDALNLIRNDRLFVDFDANTATPKGYQHAVTSHFADVIERNTGLKLVKKEGSKEVEADYWKEYAPEDWRHWRLASAALLTVPDKEGTVRKEIFKGAKSKPGRLAKWPKESFPASKETKAAPPKVSVPKTPEDTSKASAPSPDSVMDSSLITPPTTRKGAW
eukprot:TRINITY_DN5618_c0_g1_i1.p1 TRINITY_DN5618_c0_g1~~TRINITY_DN5618_c0_g1_i1.p1  ORF type:complete len:834 (-),score=233.78 TRINITY_DN5618_c0_g1_i1:369-2870(-)